MNFIIGLLFFILIIIFVIGMTFSLALPETCILIDAKVRNWVESKFKKED